MIYRTVKEIERLVGRTKTKMIDKIYTENKWIVIYIVSKDRSPFSALRVKIRNF